jgi:uncharacterized membrane protein YeaQ/YmgE (transglycosylase-associated protein family)
MGMGILTWIILGLVAGWLAGQFMRGGYGLVGDFVLKIAGAIVGGYVDRLILGRDLPPIQQLPTLFTDPGSLCCWLLR